MSHLSDKQREIFDYIRSYIDEKGVSPSVREIGQAVGLRSTSTVQYHLTALENAGYIERDPLLKRTLRLTGGAQSHAGRVPLLGTVTAGMPILAVEEIEDYIPYGGRTEGKTLFALHVRALLGYPVGNIAFHGPAASAALLGQGRGNKITYRGLDKALAVGPDCAVRIFGKPDIDGERRLGVALARAATVKEAVEQVKAMRAAIEIEITADKEAAKEE